MVPSKKKLACSKGARLPGLLSKESRFASRAGYALAPQKCQAFLLCTHYATGGGKFTRRYSILRGRPSSRLVAVLVAKAIQCSENTDHSLVKNLVENSR